MATRKINYKDKSPLQTKPEIPEENKVNAEDLNQIKEVVNNNADEIELRQLKEEGKGLSKNDFTDELKAKLESLNNYNDTEIKKEISEINKKVAENTENDIKQDNEILELKTNYTNLQEQNTKLEEKIKKDRENMINLEVEGQSIHIEDSSDLEGKLEVLGNVEQDVREGYNLFNVKNISNKFITDNGVEQANEDWVLSDFIEVEEFTDYLLGWTSTSPVFQARIILYNKDKSFMQVLNFFYENMYKKTFRTIQNCKYVRISYSTSVRGQEVKRKNVQLVKGTTEKPYEQYGASPTPEYPSEIRAVGDNINLWDKENMLVELGGYSGSNGNKYDSTTRIRNTKDIELKKDTYTLSAENSKLISIYIVDLKKELSSNGDSVTFTLEKDNTIRFTIENTALLNTEIKLERGNKKTGYSPYGQGSVEIKKTTANYYNVKNLTGASKPVDKNDWITFKSTNTGENTTYLNYFTTNLDLVIGKKYWIVAEIKEAVGEGNFSITSRMNNQGQFDTHTVSAANLKSGDLVIYPATALSTQGTEQGLRTFMSLSAGQSCNITFRLSVLETEPNKSNWKYVPYKKETKILPIQKPMLIRDYLDKLNNKEVHTWKKIVLDGVNNKVTQTTTNQSGKYRYQYTDKDLKNCSLSEEKAYCTHLQLIEKNKTYDKIVGFTVSNGSLLIYTDGDTAVNFNAKLQKENYIFYIPVIESAYEKIDLTPEQTKILDELDNFQTYKPVTNITTDSIAKLKLKYIADTKTYVDNKTSNLEQQVSVINQLLSTTKTSSVLLDNLQKDIEREVL